MLQRKQYDYLDLEQWEPISFFLNVPKCYSTDVKSTHFVIGQSYCPFWLWSWATHLNLWSASFPLRTKWSMWWSLQLAPQHYYTSSDSSKVSVALQTPYQWLFLGWASISYLESTRYRGEVSSVESGQGIMKLITGGKESCPLGGSRHYRGKRKRLETSSIKLWGTDRSEACSISALPANI